MKILPADLDRCHNDLPFNQQKRESQVYSSVIRGLREGIQGGFCSCSCLLGGDQLLCQQSHCAASLVIDTWNLRAGETGIFVTSEIVRRCASADYGLATKPSGFWIAPD